LTTSKSIKKALPSCALGLLLSVAGGTLSAQTIHLEAENGRVEGQDLKAVRPDTPAPGTLPERAGYSGTGYVTGFHQSDDRLVLKFKVKTAGVYNLTVGYACDGSKGYVIEVNDAKISGMFPSTGGMRFADVSVGKVELNAGQNAIAFDKGWGYFDIDYAELKIAPPPPAPLRPMDKISDAHATPEAVALLAKLDDSYGKGTMLGVYNDDDAQYVQETTGFRPAIMGGDLLDYPVTPLAHGTSPKETERLIADAKAGYTITMSWHWRPPLGVLDKVMPNGDDARWYMSFYTRATTFDVTVAMQDAGSPERAALVKDLDLIAVQLKRLDAAGVPVLWRPLHEAQGKWFWWGAKGPKPFIWLWQFTYNRLVNEDGVHNLVWVFTAGDDPAWYPGDAYVDVVGIDAYPEDLHDPESGLWDQLQKQFNGHKPVTISEFGGVPDVPKMQRLGEFWSYAVSWQHELGPKKNGPDELKRIYADAGALKLPAAAKPATVDAGGTAATQAKP
jgi:mannan endo-1,4-beta-mannosidase